MTWYLFALEDLSTIGRICYECAQFGEWADFHALQNGRNKKASICKSCKSQQRKIQRSLRKANPPPTLCEGCGDDAPLQLDHDHESGEFRAYLCVTCNLSMRRWNWARVNPLSFNTLLGSRGEVVSSDCVWAFGQSERSVYYDGECRMCESRSSNLYNLLNLSNLYNLANL
jgi:protein-arginine kinase activator protein McsA